MDAPKPRGFAALTPERRAEISRKGGAGGKGSPNRPWAIDRDAARIAAAKGGSAPRRKKAVDGEPTA